MSEFIEALKKLAKEEAEKPEKPNFFTGVLGDVKKRLQESGGAGNILEQAQEKIRSNAQKLPDMAETAAKGLGVLKTLAGSIKRTAAKATKMASLEEAFVAGFFDELMKTAEEPDEYLKRDPEIGEPIKPPKRKYKVSVGGPAAITRGEPTSIAKDIPASWRSRMARLRQRLRK